MFTPLVPITFDSIYNNGPLPSRMARCTPDTFAALFAIKKDLSAVGADLILSDLFRSHDMQLQAHLDFVTGKKKAFSPAPGGSLHEAGRAFDMDLSKIRVIGLNRFWEIAATHGVLPIVTRPDTKLSESWHFSCRGSHTLVYNYYKANKGDNFASPYAAMAASGIVSIGQQVDILGPDVISAYIQSGLIRLGAEIGDLDGKIGPKTNGALRDIGIDGKLAPPDKADLIDQKLQAAFPDEFFTPGVVFETPGRPSHLIA